MTTVCICNGSVVFYFPQIIFDKEAGLKDNKMYIMIYLVNIVHMVSYGRFLLTWVAALEEFSVDVIMVRLETEPESCHVDNGHQYGHGEHQWCNILVIDTRITMLLKLQTKNSRYPLQLLHKQQQQWQEEWHMSIWYQFWLQEIAVVKFLSVRFIVCVTMCITAVWVDFYCFIIF